MSVDIIQGIYDRLAELERGFEKLSGLISGAKADLQTEAQLWAAVETAAAAKLDSLTVLQAAEADYEVKSMALDTALTNLAVFKAAGG
jgi:hypothetical protein